MVGSGLAATKEASQAADWAALGIDGVLGLALCGDLGQDRWAHCVDDVFGGVEEGRNLGTTLIEVGGLGRGGGCDQGAVGPVDVGQARLECRTVGRAAPRRLGCQVEIALSHGLAISVGPRLEELAVLPHWHGHIVAATGRHLVSGAPGSIGGVVDGTSPLASQRSDPSHR